MGGDIPISEWKSTEEALARAFAADFQGQSRLLSGNVFAVDTDRVTMLIRHPFEKPTDEVDPESCDMTERMDLAFLEAQEDLGDRRIVFVNSFDLQRRPGWVATKLAEL